MSADPVGPGVPSPGAMSPADERMWAGAAHWGALVASAVAGLSFLGPLLVLAVKGQESMWVRRHAVDSLNFQLSMLLYTFVIGAASFLLFFTIVAPLVGMVALFALLALWLVLTILGAVKCINGEAFAYPLTIRFIS